MVYEPALNESHFFGSKVIRDLEAFKGLTDIIIANRNADCLSDVQGKVFSRDIFGDN